MQHILPIFSIYLVFFTSSDATAVEGLLQRHASNQTNLYLTILGTTISAQTGRHSLWATIFKRQNLDKETNEGYCYGVTKACSVFTLLKANFHPDSFGRADTRIFLLCESRQPNMCQLKPHVARNIRSTTRLW